MQKLIRFAQLSVYFDAIFFISKWSQWTQMPLLFLFRLGKCVKKKILLPDLNSTKESFVWNNHATFYCFIHTARSILSILIQWQKKICIFFSSCSSNRIWNSCKNGMSEILLQKKVFILYYSTSMFSVKKKFNLSFFLILFIFFLSLIIL